MTLPSTVSRSPRLSSGTHWNRASLIVAATAFACVLVAAFFVPPYLTLDPGASPHRTPAGFGTAPSHRRYPRGHRRNCVTHRSATVQPTAAPPQGLAPLDRPGLPVRGGAALGPQRSRRHPANFQRAVAMTAFLTLDILWLITALAAYRTARTGQYAEHRKWMLRNFSLTFAAVTLRIWLIAMIAIQLPWLGSLYGGDFKQISTTAYTVSQWMSWLPNLLLVEIYLARRAARDAQHALAAAAQKQPAGTAK